MTAGNTTYVKLEKKKRFKKIKRKTVRGQLSVDWLKLVYWPIFRMFWIPSS